MVRIGAVTIDTSHPLAFARKLAEGSRARYTAIFNDGFRQQDEVDAFVREFGLTHQCQTLEELASLVDIGFVHCCNWDHRLAHVLPFVKSNTPVFVDKPIAGDLRTCLELESLAKQGAKIFGASSARYAEEIVSFLATPLSQRGEILHISATVGVDEFNYGIHVTEILGALLGTGAEHVKFCGCVERSGKKLETFYVSYPQAAATFNICFGTWQPFEVVIMTTTGTYQFRINTERIYAALLDRIFDTLEGKTDRLATISTLTESVKIMLAARNSRKNGGKPFPLEDLRPDEAGFSGTEFAIEYARNASKIYL